MLTLLRIFIFLLLNIFYILRSGRQRRGRPGERNRHGSAAVARGGGRGGGGGRRRGQGGLGPVQRRRPAGARRAPRRQTAPAASQFSSFSMEYF